MSELVKCDQSETCNSDRCIHKTPHHKDDVCNMPCGTSANRATCVMVVSSMGQHSKPPRKRSAPLYGELLNERELLKIENHNMRLEIQSLRMANEGLRNRLTGYDTASMSKLVALWFRNRKGGGK